MLSPLLPTEFERARPIFAPLDDHLAIQAVLAGATPGVIYTDNAADPGSALLRVHHRFYLAGDPGNTAFNQALHRLFTEHIYPEGHQAGLGGCVFYLAAGWEEAVEEELLDGLFPIPLFREYYELERLQVDWREMLPEGFTMRAVDGSLMQQTNLRNLAELQEEMQSERESIQAFLEKSFGICLLHGDEIAGWCLSEYNLGERCEVGIATGAAYQRRGLATITGAALVEQALARGIRRIGWHCWTDNIASSATAKKIGYRLVREGKAFFSSFDAGTNLAIHGDIQLNHGSPRSALDWFERAFQQPGAPSWAYVRAACAAARLENCDQAFAYLQQALDKGGTRLSRLQDNEDLAILRSDERWGKLAASQPNPD